MTVDLWENRVGIERRPVGRNVTATETAFLDQSTKAEEYRAEAVASREARDGEGVAQD